MSDRAQNHLQETLEELYRIDPALKEFEADLPNLISTLKRHQPTVSLDTAFVDRLRASLLSQAKPSMTPAAGVPSPYLWWAVRLSPVGIALVLFLVLSPEQAYMPTDDYVAERSAPTETSLEPSQDVADTARSAQVATNEPQLESAPAEAGDVSIMAADPTTLTMDMPEPALAVAPPLVGSTVTITSLELPEAGWVVVYEDVGGSFGEILATQYLQAGSYQDTVLNLTRTLAYPELITIGIYTATTPEMFTPEDERIQNDPATSVPMLVTVPVISELEQGLEE